MTKLSIIIVNYNVQYFLEHCISSIYRSKVNFSYEIIVVDNASTDQSVEMVQQHFPNVKIIENKNNAGFAKANNQAINIAHGAYCLLLNPDTILQEDTLQKSIDTLDSDTKIGALGVKMLDGSGNYLPESKRGFPSPSVSFYKMFGLSKLFPNSKIFNQYHLGHLDENQNHEVDVLSGAYMMIRKNVLNTIGNLDENYFMYGEDIDLSYQIKKAGYKNYYLSTTNIIHFKGESTKKGSLNYIKLFFGAMLLFAKKNLPSKQYKLLFPLLHIGIFIQAILGIARQAANKILFPIFDLGFIFSILFFLKFIFENYIKANEKLSYPMSFIYFNIPLYTIVSVFCLYILKVYQKYYTWKNIFVALSFAFVIISILYSFFPLSLRSSRAIILVSYLINIFLLIGYRALVNYLIPVAPNIFQSTKKYALVCNTEEIENIKQTMTNYYKKSKFIGYINDSPTSNDNFVGTTKQINDIVKAYAITDIIFSTNSIKMKDIIRIMSQTNNCGIHYRMYNTSQHIVSSQSKNTQGEILQLSINTQNRKYFIDKIIDWINQ